MRSCVNNEGHIKNNNSNFEYTCILQGASVFKITILNPRL